MEPLRFLIQLTRQTGKLLLDFFHETDLKTSLKADRSVVTAADLAADQWIASAIHQQYPNDILLSEELSPRLPEGWAPDGRAVWIIDPIDGTTNFSLGLQIWGVVIARLVAGYPETAVIYFPAIDELYSAQKGQGAFLNGQPVHAHPPDPDHPGAFFTCCSRAFRKYQITVPYKVRILGSAAYSLCNVARGAAVVGFEATPKIWDIAAGWLLVTEANGAVATLDGSKPFPLQPGIDYASHSFPTISAATTDLVIRMSACIQPQEKG